MTTWKSLAVAFGIAAIVVGSVVASFYWDPSADWIAGYRVTSGQLLSQGALGGAQLRLDSDEQVVAHTACRHLSPGETYVLSERTQVDGDREYVVVCLDANCDRVPGCSFVP